MFKMFKQIFELKKRLSKAEDRINKLEVRNAMLLKSKEDVEVKASEEIHRLCSENKTLQNMCKSLYKSGVLDLADRLKMQSVLVGDELYITMEESELDGLVKELTGGD